MFSRDSASKTAIGPSFATAFMRRPYPALGGRAVMGQCVPWCGALPCCESGGMHWCSICRDGGAVVMVAIACGDCVSAQA